jgi:hypothetical protein
MRLIEIAAFRFPSDPDFIMFTTELERAGIKYTCPERTQLENQPFLSIGLGGLRVLVEQADVARAKAILEEVVGQPDEAQDEADIEIANRKAEEEAAFQRNYKRMRMLLLFVVFLILLAWLLGRITH